MENLIRLRDRFIDIFGEGGEIISYFAPGRVNLIGEHTDYNGGHVFPCALTIGTYALARKNGGNKLRFYSDNFPKDGVITVPYEELQYGTKDGWANYPKSVVWTFEKNGFKLTEGMDILYYGNIPNSSGLSSSASIEVATGFILNTVFMFNLDMAKIALYCQYGENQFIGVNCGIMDQFAIAMGKKDHAIFLDTGNLEYEYAPIELGDAKIVIACTNKKRGLSDSKYNERRQECEDACEELKQVIDITTLGELTEEQFETYKMAIKDDVRRKRAKHAVYENQRTIKAVSALKANNIELFGQLMNESHQSLRDDYEVTGIELDTLVGLAQQQEGVIGARMTGAGFGGSTVSIVKVDKIDKFIQNVGTEYEKKIGYKADFYVVEIGDGPSIIQ